MSFSCQKGEIDRFLNRLDRPVEKSRPGRQPDRLVDRTGFHLWISDQVDRASATEADHKNWYSQLPCLTLSNKQLKGQCEASTV